MFGALGEAVIVKTRLLTFVSGHSEHCRLVVDDQESHVFVVDDKLWILEAIVSQQEVLDDVGLGIAQVMFEEDVEHLNRSFVVPRVVGFALLTSSSVEFPVNSLHDGVDEPEGAEERNRQNALKQQRPPDRHIDVRLLRKVPTTVASLA